MKDGVMEPSKGNCVSLSMPEYRLDEKESYSNEPEGVTESVSKTILSQPGPYHRLGLSCISDYIGKKLLENMKCCQCLFFFSFCE
ncbi:hypothetical protein RRG08_016710 [Elysia crispata]|uniref:Uncharacterized protein n=1 Tax=Elysia crispata TaxID=231223 RepID=A0AAE0ZSE2_9GAST|nr:hypothetical protein RRG08_016710 [Elysia crispata]